MWVAVLYTTPTCRMYIGQTQEVNLNENTVMVKFLEEDHISHEFKWPRRPDIETVEPIYILKTNVKVENIYGKLSFRVPELKAIGKKMKTYKKKYL